MRLTERYSDIIDRSKAKKSLKSGDEIVADIIKKNGLKFRKGGINERI
jgi:hypothetical protein